VHGLLRRDASKRTFSSLLFSSPLTQKCLQKFNHEGCPNCDHVLQLRGNNDAIQECTSQVFEGLISIVDERQSWVARWQRLDGYVPGTYAIKVTGTLPTETVASLEDAGIKYIP
jgi:transcription elongation factor SPT4